MNSSTNKFGEAFNALMKKYGKDLKGPKKPKYDFDFSEKAKLCTLHGKTKQAYLKYLKEKYESN